MKHRDPILEAILCWFVPFYEIYWFYSVSGNMRKHGYPAPSKALLITWILSPLLLFVLFILAIVAKELTFLWLVSLFALLFIFIITARVFWALSFAVEKVTNGQTSAVLLFILFWVLSPVAVYLAQDGLNKAPGNSNPLSSPTFTQQNNQQIMQPKSVETPQKPIHDDF